MRRAEVAILAGMLMIGDALRSGSVSCGRATLARSSSAVPGYDWRVVSTELVAKVAALSEDERVELVGYIESSLEGGALPTPEQHELVTRRDAELGANPDLGLTRDEAIAAIRALRA